MTEKEVRKEICELSDGNEQAVNTLGRIYNNYQEEAPYVFSALWFFKVRGSAIPMLVKNFCNNDMNLFVKQMSRSGLEVIRMMESSSGGEIGLNLRWVDRTPNAGSAKKHVLEDQYGKVYAILQQQQCGFARYDAFVMQPADNLYYKLDRGVFQENDGIIPQLPVQGFRKVDDSNQVYCTRSVIAALEEIGKRDPKIAEAVRRYKIDHPNM